MKLLFDRDLGQVIADCAKGDIEAKALLYNRYSDMLYGICLRYLKNKQDAEDVLQDTFVRIYRGINTYKGNGSFEGWIKTTCVRTALRFLEKKQKDYANVSLDELDFHVEQAQSILSTLSVKELMELVMGLPTGYRIVFNMYAIEGYKHKEIAQELNISIGTSKSQFARAKQILQAQVVHLYGSNPSIQRNAG